MWRWMVAALLSLPLLAGTSLADVPGAVRQAELLNLLQQDCGSCHGLTLRGGLGPALLPPDLAGKPRALLVAAVRDGRPGTAMPPWAPLLSPSDIDWLVDRLLAGDGALK